MGNSTPNWGFTLTNAMNSPATIGRDGNNAKPRAAHAIVNNEFCPYQMARATPGNARKGLIVVQLNGRKTCRNEYT
ncbi:hypothetical protein GCM10011400_32730 [Paraburkholderia caffeinilytica]|uniref:Uncharacterized protein n=1 Tax=Paraburkholderia caffeinilytica TaxID=1761016 RepID=A0ABQ1MP13_9BURK|nr:hypothetical protein GCM10011400_32730 [Paraburkholderia caffeinilytica]